MPLTAEERRAFERERAADRADDLVFLQSDSLSHDGVTECLGARYDRNDIYTFIGPDVLIAVNPYKSLEKAGLSIYDLRVAQHYLNSDPVEVAPHSYAVAANAFRDLLASGTSQCVLVTGESGAGKTETAKQLMRLLTFASVSRDYSGKSNGFLEGDAELSAAAQDVRSRLLESNPVLEAFGNAKTERNDNSSRFGKYMKLQVDFTGDVVGGQINSFLLEKTRVTDFNPKEGAFHVFHMLLSSARRGTLAADIGVDELPEYLSDLGDPHHCFSYCENPGSGESTVSQNNEINLLPALVGSMKKCEFTSAELTDIWRLLVGILHLGNVRFENREMGNSGPSAVLADDTALRRAAAAFGIPSQHVQGALTAHILQGKTKARNSITVVKHDAAEATRTRDSLARELYKRLFEWLISRINGSIDARPDGANAQFFERPWTSGLYIGILDVYGFEIFEHNSFEQFCINYTNEVLQQLFISATLKSEQDDYMQEGIDWVEVDYFDNKDVVKLIDGRGGILGLLDEVSTFRDASIEKLMNSFSRSLAEHPHFKVGADDTGPYDPVKRRNSSLGTRLSHGVLKAIGLSSEADDENLSAKTGVVPRFLPDEATLFSIVHYAGKVTYTATLFLEKNADSFYSSLKQSMAAAEVETLANLFKQAQESGRKPPSMGSQFKQQVATLQRELQASHPRYIRCIKPNDKKSPNIFDSERVVHQCQYLGLLENVRVRRAGYCYRASYDTFLRRYFCVSHDARPYRVGVEAFRPGSADLSREIANKLMSSGKPRTLHGSAPLGALTYTQGEAYDLGRTKIFVKHPETIFALEAMRRTQMFYIVIPLQIAARKFIQRRRAAIKIQSVVRGFNDRTSTRAMRRRFHNRPPRFYAGRIQRVWRGHKARRSLPADIARKCWLLATAHQRRHAASVRLNSLFRRHLAKLYSKRRHKATFTLTIAFRKIVARLRAIRKAQAEEDRIVSALRIGIPVQRCRKGGLLSKKGQLVECKLQVESDPWKIKWDPSSGGSSRGRLGVPLSLLGRVERGRITEPAQSHIGKEYESRSFSLVADPRRSAASGPISLQEGETLDFIVESEVLRNQMTRVLLRLMAKTRGRGQVSGKWVQTNPKLASFVLL